MSQLGLLTAKSAAALVFLFSFAATLPAAAQPTFSLGLRDRPPIQGSFTLFPRSRSRPQASASAYTVILTETTVRPRENIQTLLRRNGIKPDVNSYTLLYEANPSLSSVDSVRAGTSLLLPVLQPMETSAVAGAAVAVLDLYSKQKAELKDEAQATSLDISVLLTEMQPLNSRDDAPIATVLDELRHRLRFLNPSRSTAGRTTLTHLTFELRYLRDLLDNRRVRPDRSREPAAQHPAAQAIRESFPRRQEAAEDRDIREVADAILRDIRTFEQCSQRGESCEVSVLVNTVVQVGPPEKGLQVYAIPHALARHQGCLSDPMCLRTFRKLSSPAIHELPVGTPFLLWAERNGQVVTDRKAYTPGRRRPNEMDLLVTRP